MKLPAVVLFVSMLSVRGEFAEVITIGGQKVSGELSIRDGKLSLTDTNTLKTNSVAFKDTQEVRIAHAVTNSDSARKPKIILVNGTTLAGKIEKADDTAVHLTSPWPVKTISTINVARIVLRDLTPELSERIPHGRAGVLLRNKDFVDGDFRGFKDGHVKIESVLFGSKSLGSGDVVAIVLRPVSMRSTLWVIQFTDKSELFAANLSGRGGELISEEPLLGPVALDPRKINTIRRR